MAFPTWVKKVTVVILSMKCPLDTAWTIAQSERINVLCGGRKPHHVMKNAKSGELIMTKEDIAKMNEDIENLYSSLGTSIKGNLF